MSKSSRRKFLQQLGSSGLAVSAGSILAFKPSNEIILPEEKINWPERQAADCNNRNGHNGL